MHTPTILIAGAGPTGLAAALFLKQRGIHSRIVDTAPEPSPYSKALAVNPRTLELLESTGVTTRMLAEGRPLDGARFYENWHTLATLDVTSLHPKYRLLALRQSRSEAILAEALAAAGIEVERGLTLDDFTQDARVDAQLLDRRQVTQAVHVDALFAADGAGSAARQLLNLAFDGTEFPEAWTLYDLELDTPLDLTHAHVSFSEQGLVFMLALDRKIWRVMSNFGNPLDHMPPATVAGPAVWHSTFHVSHRVSAHAAAGLVALGGDAAHIHSPIGGRGMNMGIEDAYAFAICVAGSPGDMQDRLLDYNALRHPVHRSVVRRVKALTTLARGESALLRTIRHFALPVAGELSPARNLMARTIAGLDHPMPSV